LIPRRVEGFSLESREVCVLNEALVSWHRRQSNAIERDLRFQGRDITGRYGLEGRVTHLWMCSVLNDPDALPARSDLIDNGVVDPEKLGTETCKDLEPEYRTKKLLRDRARAAQVVETCWRMPRFPALLTMTDDALPWFENRARREGLDRSIEKADFHMPCGFEIWQALIGRR